MLTLPVAMLFPALWAMSPSRRVAALVSAGYFLAASRGLPQGVANFYSADLWPGFLLWFAASASFVAVHAVAWTRHPGIGRAVRYLAAGVLTGLPPFGITGWAHPLTAAGVPHVLQANGNMFSVFFTDAPAVPDYATAAGQDAGAFKAFFHAMLDQGVYLPPSAFEVWFCSSAHDDRAVQHVIDALPVAAEAAARHTSGGGDR